ncbi:MAG TPA: class I SAM-dependent methyltransferase [Candidatus Binatia bacterium]|nr:class I SAM-dependent methyltransferase [Candidatus Binatia bacterium]
MSSLTDKEKLTKGFYDRNAHSWSNQHMSRGYWAKQIAEFKKLLPKGKILEVGCGGGRDAKELIALGYSYTGSDVSSGLLKEAKQNLPEQKFVLQSVYELSFPEKFDGLWASAVLLHIPKARIDEALSSIKSVLKPGAIAYISLKNGEGEEVIGEDDSARFFAFWKKEEFSKALARNGLEVINYIHDPRSLTDDWHCFFTKLTGS